MFDVLKKKLSKAIESISEKFKKKEEVSKKAEAIKEEIEKKIEKLEEKKPEEIIEEIKPTIQEIPEVEKIIEDARPEIERAKPKEKKSLLKKITEKIVKKIAEKKLSEEDLEPILNELTLGLIEADVAYEVAEKIKNDLKNSLVGKEVKRGEEKEFVIFALRQSLLEILSVPKVDLEEVIKKAKSENRPAVLVFLGFNGSGKTTSLAKVGKWLMNKNYTCVFVAGDSWRKAAIEQLEEHGKKLQVTVIKHKYGADPAAIVYDGIEYCKARGINVLLADTAGRTHLNKNLIEELKKIVRVNKPDLKILVMDSLVGNDAVPQSQMFNDAVDVDAIIFTKNDVNPRGGAVLSVSYLLKKPILFLGIGQNHSDLLEFDAVQFVNRLLAE